ncbi:hypothetical protein [Thiocapsa imhoffii]|nr:hypothetical protein [Thiocapsa imhoffii]
MSIEKERIALFALVFMLAISLIGASYARYLIYTAPVVIFFIWLTTPGLRIKFNPDLIPFYIIFIFSLLTIHAGGVEGIKTSIFMGVYIITFTLFDFSKISIRIDRIGLVLILIFILHAFIGGSAGDAVEFSVLDSKSSFESTLAFPFGLISSYYLIQRQYIKGIFFGLFALLGLKRIALLGVFVIFILILAPKKIQLLLVSKLSMVIVSFVYLIFVVSFSYGIYDQYILNYFGITANHLSQGRQLLWRNLLDYSNFDFLNFLFIGLGNSKSIIILQDIYGSRVLLHSDIFLIYIEYGLILAMLFVITLFAQKRIELSLLPVFLFILFLTDNVLIYQHVMILYLLCQSQLRRIYDSA